MKLVVYGQLPHKSRFYSGNDFGTMVLLSMTEYCNWLGLSGLESVNNITTVFLIEWFCSSVIIAKVGSLDGGFQEQYGNGDFGTIVLL